MDVNGAARYQYCSATRSYHLSGQCYQHVMLAAA